MIAIVRWALAASAGLALVMTLVTILAFGAEALTPHFVLAELALALMITIPIAVLRTRRAAASAR